MNNYFELNKTIGASYNTDPDDVTNAKTALETSGHYKVPDHGITPFPDTPLIEGIKSYQKDNNLKVDGVMKPSGETVKSINNMAAKKAQSTNPDFEGRTFTIGCVPKGGWKDLRNGKAWNPRDRQIYRCMTTHWYEKPLWGNHRWIGMNQYTDM